MITTDIDDGLAIVSPDGSYTQGEFRDALDRVFTLCPDGRASCLIMDFTRSLLAQTPSIVRRRELARDIASRAAHFGRRVAIVVSPDQDAHLLDAAIAITMQQGIESRVCHDLPEARSWATRTGSD